MRARGWSVAVRGVMAVMGVLAGAFSAGCAGPDAPQAGGPVRSGVTGVEIVLRREQPEQRQFVYFRLTPDRTLVYTAGRKAMRNENPQERPTWSGTVPPEVYQELVSMARAARAAEGVEATASMPTYRLVVIDEGELFPGELVGGPSPALDELYRRLVRVQTDARAEELDPARLPR